MPVLVTLIGDLVGSRELPDRAATQRRVDAVLGDVTALLDPEQALEPTVGDEFQGAFTTVPDALLASLLVRLRLLPEVDVRCGLGWGQVTVHDAGRRPLLQDGPGWWAARDALDALERPRSAGEHTWYVGPDAIGTNAMLVIRDALVDRVGDRGRRMLLAALEGRSQAEIAALEGVSRSAVSQQFARGVGALRDAHLGFGELDPGEPEEPG